MCPEQIAYAFTTVPKPWFPLIPANKNVERYSNIYSDFAA